MRAFQTIAFTALCFSSLPLVSSSPTPPNLPDPSLVYLNGSIAAFGSELGLDTRFSPRTCTPTNIHPTFNPSRTVLTLTFSTPQVAIYQESRTEYQHDRAVSHALGDCHVILPITVPEGWRYLVREVVMAGELGIWNPAGHPLSGRVERVLDLNGKRDARSTFWYDPSGPVPAGGEKIPIGKMEPYKITQGPQPEHPRNGFEFSQTPVESSCGPEEDDVYYGVNGLMDAFTFMLDADLEGYVMDLETYVMGNGSMGVSGVEYHLDWVRC